MSPSSEGVRRTGWGRIPNLEFKVQDSFFPQIPEISAEKEESKSFKNVFFRSFSKNICASVAKENFEKILLFIAHLSK